MARKKQVNTTVRYEIRFRHPEHYEMIRQAASDTGVSINQWLVMHTLKMAKAQLAESRKLAQVIGERSA